MLKDDFYTIVTINTQVVPVNFTLQLNEQHAIFNGHFPGQPVVPGACLMQTVKEIMEVVMEDKLQLLRADELKFLIPVNPVDNNILNGSISYAIDDNAQMNVVANLSQNNAICFKCKMTFTRK